MEDKSKTGFNGREEEIEESGLDDLMSELSQDADSFRIEDLDLDNLDDLDLGDFQLDDLDISLDDSNGNGVKEEDTQERKPQNQDRGEENLSDFGDSLMEDLLMEEPPAPVDRDVSAKEKQEEYQEEAAMAPEMDSAVPEDTDDLLVLEADPTEESSALQKEPEEAGKEEPEEMEIQKEPEVADDKENQENKETFDPMGDVEDLLGMLAEEEAEPLPMEDLSLNDFSGEEPQEPEEAAEASQEDIFSLDFMPEDAFEQLAEEEKTEPGEANKKDGKKAEKKKKAGIFKRLFGNVHDEKAIKAKQELEEKEAAKKPKKTKEELKAEKAAKKKEQLEVKKAQDAKKAELKAQKDAEKKEKKEQKKQAALEAAAAEEVDEGRINRVGASIVVLFFGLIAAGVVFGSNSFAYTQSIDRATEEFGAQDYNGAYNEIRGIHIKDKDREIYDKIMTVMYVNKQLNSYNNYYNMQMYPEALDSLLKGLHLYDEYFSIAKQLGIQSDMDYVRKQIVGELSSIYSLSEDEAYGILGSESQDTYSQKVFEAASVK